MQSGFTASEIVKQYKLGMDATGSGGSKPDALRARERCAMPRGLWLRQAAGWPEMIIWRIIWGIDGCQELIVERETVG